jgi:hypothetical protein
MVTFSAWGPDVVRLRLGVNDGAEDRQEHILALVVGVVGHFRSGS